MQGGEIDRKGPIPVSIESFHLTRQRALAEDFSSLPESGGER
jgi:hypothetical protein